jgi:hypothetical protein
MEETFAGSASCSAQSGQSFRAAKDIVGGANVKEGFRPPVPKRSDKGGIHDQILGEASTSNFTSPNSSRKCYGK